MKFCLIIIKKYYETDTRKGTKLPVIYINQTKRVIVLLYQTEEVVSEAYICLDRGAEVVVLTQNQKVRREIRNSYFTMQTEKGRNEYE